MKILMIVILFVPLAFSQALSVSQTETTSNLPAQKIGPRDLLAIQVYKSPELTRTVRVGADGLIRLPMLKQRLQAEGLMPNQLEDSLAKAFEVEGLLVSPYVTVTVAEYSSHPISVAGAVRSPLTFQASGPVTLLEAITRAGGLTAEAGAEILVSKSQQDDPYGSASLIHRIPVKSLIDAAEPDSNLSLTGGEEVRVPAAGKVFVVGNVKKPGVFSIQDGSETSVLKVLALAEGLTRFSSKKAYVYRREASGTKNELSIELSRIMKRQAPDVTLTANDVLYIPDDAGRRLSAATLEKLLLFGTTAGATALIYHP